MTILDEIAVKTKERIKREKEMVSPAELSHKAEALPRSTAKVSGEGYLAGEYAFYRALAKDGISFICEVKKASPSKGLIAEDFPYRDIAKEYEASGASAISCLTEPYWFLGSDEYLRNIVSDVRIPVLRKDFTIDRYMVDQAAVMGAGAILLICAILSDAELREYHKRADELGLSCLVEAHDEGEIERALSANARIIGVNNRNLKDFSVDPQNALKLRSMIPKDVLFVAESGISTAEDIAALREGGVDAVLIGETLMRAEDKRAKLTELAGGSL